MSNNILDSVKYFDLDLPFIEHNDNLLYEVYENNQEEKSDIKTFVRIDDQKVKNYVSKYKTEKFDPTLINKMKHMNICQPLNLHIEDDYVFVGYEYFSISLKNYISCTNPSIEIRLDLYSQFLSLVFFLIKNEIDFQPADVKYFFIKNLNLPILKVFYHGFVDIERESNKFTKSDPIFWLLLGFFTIFKNYQSLNNEMVYEKYDENAKSMFLSLKNICILNLNSKQITSFIQNTILDKFIKILIFFNIEKPHMLFEIIIQDKMTTKERQLAKIGEKREIFRVEPAQIVTNKENLEKIQKIPKQEYNVPIIENLIIKDKRPQFFQNIEQEAEKNPFIKFSILNPNAYFDLIKTYYINKFHNAFFFQMLSTYLRNCPMKSNDTSCAEKENLTFLNDLNFSRRNTLSNLEKVNSKKTNYTDHEKPKIFKLSRDLSKNSLFTRRKRQRSESVSISSYDKNEFSQFEDSDIYINESLMSDTKKEDEDINWVFEDSLKKQNLKIELDLYKPYYLKDLEESKKLAGHVFMKNNFPEMYKIENFYIHSKLRPEKLKKSFKNLFSADISGSNLAGYGNFKLEKKTWDPRVFSPEKGSQLLILKLVNS